MRSLVARKCCSFELRLNEPLHDKTNAMTCAQPRLGSAWPFEAKDLLLLRADS